MESPSLSATRNDARSTTLESREGRLAMIHITCDLCGKPLTPGDDTRYIVKVEVFPSPDDALLTEADLDEDHMEELSQLLQDLEEDRADEEPVAPSYCHFRYDLCPSCQKKFVRDPLGRESGQKFDFSSN